MDEPLRLAKRVAALAGCSRREAELLIEGGWVRVDGVAVDEPQHRVTGAQRIEIDPAARGQPLPPLTVLLHCPPGAGEEQARALLLPANRLAGDRRPLATARRLPGQLLPLLALPPAASGLAVYSQQRGVIRRLTEDAAVLEQEFVADVAGDIAEGGLARLCHGLVHGQRPLPPIKVSWQSERRLRFALKGIAPALLPWMCEQVGLRVLALRRLRIGRVPLAGLPPGQWRLLRPDERF